MWKWVNLILRLFIQFVVNKKTPIRAFRDPDWIQTNDLLLRRQLLYSTELPDPLPDNSEEIIDNSCCYLGRAKISDFFAAYCISSGNFS